MDQLEQTNRIWFSTSGNLRMELLEKQWGWQQTGETPAYSCLPAARAPPGTELRDVIHLLLVIGADRSCMFSWQHWQSTCLFSTRLPRHLWEPAVQSPAGSVPGKQVPHTGRAAALLPGALPLTHTKVTIPTTAGLEANDVHAINFPQHPKNLFAKRSRFSKCLQSPFKGGLASSNIFLHG